MRSFKDEFFSGKAINTNCLREEPLSRREAEDLWQEKEYVIVLYPNGDIRLAKIKGITSDGIVIGKDDSIEQSKYYTELDVLAQTKKTTLINEYDPGNKPDIVPSSYVFPLSYQGSLRAGLFLNKSGLTNAYTLKNFMETNEKNIGSMADSYIDFFYSGTKMLLQRLIDLYNLKGTIKYKLSERKIHDLNCTFRNSVLCEDVYLNKNTMYFWLYKDATGLRVGIGTKPMLNGNNAKDACTCQKYKYEFLTYSCIGSNIVDREKLRIDLNMIDAYGISRSELHQAINFLSKELLGFYNTMEDRINLFNNWLEAEISLKIIVPALRTMLIDDKYIDARGDEYKERISSAADEPFPKAYLNSIGGNYR
jgi:hypothetical protein